MTDKPLLHLSRRRVLAAAPLALGFPTIIAKAYAQSEPLKFGVADPLTGQNAIFGLDQMQEIGRAHV